MFKPIEQVWDTGEAIAKKFRRMSIFLGFIVITLPQWGPSAKAFYWDSVAPLLRMDLAGVDLSWLKWSAWNWLSVPVGLFIIWRASKSPMRLEGKPTRAKRETTQGVSTAQTPPEDDGLVVKTKVVRSPRSALELIDMVGNKTSYQAEKLIAPYLGLELVVRGKVHDVHIDERFGTIRVVLDLENAPERRHRAASVYLTKEHKQLVSALGKGDSVEAVGLIEDVSGNSVRINSAQILKYGADKNGETIEGIPGIP